MAPVPEKSFTEWVNDCRTSYRSYPDWLQYSLVADPSTDAGRSVLVLHAIRQILPHTSSVHDVPLGAILEANDRTGTKANLQLFFGNAESDEAIRVGLNFRVCFGGWCWALLWVSYAWFWILHFLPLHVAATRSTRDLKSSPKWTSFTLPLSWPCLQPLRWWSSACLRNNAQKARLLFLLS